MLEEPNLRAEGCFYTGTVRGDPHSAVSVNLCHGMVSLRLKIKQING